MKKLVKILGISLASVFCVYILFEAVMYFRNKQTYAFIAAADTNDIPAMEKIIAEGYNPGQIFLGRSHLRWYLGNKVGKDDYGNVSSAVVDFMLSQGISPADEDGEIPSSLHYAVYLGNSEIAEKLLAAGADANYLIKNGFSPLDLALRLDDFALIPILEKYDAKLNYYANNKSYQFALECSKKADCLPVLTKEFPMPNRRLKE